MINIIKKFSIKKVLKAIGDIFLPIIPVSIGCGLIFVANNLLNTLPWWSGSDYSKLVAVFANSLNMGLNIFVGISAARVFKGNMMIGGVMALILTAPALVDISFFGQNLIPARGGIIAVMLVVYIACQIERTLTSIIPDMLDMLLTPFLTILVTGFLAIFIFQPIGGFFTDLLMTLINYSLGHGGIVTGFLLAFSFLPLVMLGLHRIYTPIHAQLIEVFGYTLLFPILAMAGAGQVGAALYVLIKTKNKNLKKTAISALPAAFFGVGTPLIYGVTLPLGRPFIAACIGGGFAGSFIAYFAVGGYIIDGISGISLLPLTTAPIIYAAGLVIGYIAGFIASFILGFEDPKENIKVDR